MPIDALRPILPLATFGPYLCYAASAALHTGRADGSLSEWPRLASPVAEPHAVPGTVRTICSITPMAFAGRPGAGRLPKDDLSTWVGTDDWPERVPVTSVEVHVFEAWFGDVFDELFGPCQ